MPLQPKSVHDPITVKPPHDFDPIHASPDDLQKALYPPRPNPETAPKNFAQWRDIVARKLIYVGKPFSDNPRRLDESDNWSGGIIHAADSNNDSLTAVTALSIIPNIHPNKDALGNYLDGEYRLWTWLGLDGWTNKVSLKAGVTSSLTVQNGTITSRSTEAVILYQDGDNDIYVKPFVGFTVEPGDLVWTTVWRPGRQPTAGAAFIVNLGDKTYSNAAIDNISLEGATAQWIATGRSPKDPSPLSWPSQGASFFVGGLASGTRSGSSLSQAQLVDAKHVGFQAVRAEDECLVGFGV